MPPFGWGGGWCLFCFRVVSKPGGDRPARRVNRLYLRKSARPLLAKLAGLRSELTATALEGINPADAHRLLAQLESIKENVRNAIQNPAGEPPRKAQRYG